MPPILGMNAKAYYDETPLTGSASAGSWTELDSAKVVGLGLEKSEADVTTRANDGWRATIGALKDGTIEIEMVWDHTDVGQQALTDAFINNTQLALAIMDGDILVAANEGFAANFDILGMDRTEDLEEAIMVTYTCKPSSQHQWYRVGS